MRIVARDVVAHQRTLVRDYPLTVLAVGNTFFGRPCTELVVYLGTRRVGSAHVSTLLSYMALADLNVRSLFGRHADEALSRRVIVLVIGP